jgi:hypothetical protein
MDNYNKENTGRKKNNKERRKINVRKEERKHERTKNKDRKEGRMSGGNMIERKRKRIKEVLLH